MCLSTDNAYHSLGRMCARRHPGVCLSRCPTRPTRHLTRARDLMDASPSRPQGSPWTLDATLDNVQCTTCTPHSTADRQAQGLSPCHPTLYCTLKSVSTTVLCTPSAHLASQPDTGTCSTTGATLLCSVAACIYHTGFARRQLCPVSHSRRPDSQTAFLPRSAYVSYSAVSAYRYMLPAVEWSTTVPHARPHAAPASTSHHSTPHCIASRCRACERYCIPLRGTSTHVLYIHHHPDGCHPRAHKAEGAISLPQDVITLVCAFDPGKGQCMVFYPISIPLANHSRRSTPGTPAGAAVQRAYRIALSSDSCNHRIPLFLDFTVFES